MTLLGLELSAANVIALVGLLISHGVALLIGLRRDATRRETARREQTREMQEHEDEIAIKSREQMAAEFRAVLEANTALRQELSEMREEARQGWQRVAVMEREINSLRLHVERLEWRMNQAGIEVPPRPHGGG